MKTNSDANYELREFLETSLLFTDPNKPNGILSSDRLDNSEAEDVIVEPLPLNARQIQEGVLNVNIFVQNKKLDFNGVIDRSQRDQKRLAYLERLLTDAFEGGFWGTDYNFALQQTNIIKDGNYEHFINARIEYTAVNI